jgi:hypothetical protein
MYGFEQGAAFGSHHVQEAAILVIEYWRDQYEMVSSSHTELMRLHAAGLPLTGAAPSQGASSQGPMVESAYQA